VQYLRLKFLLYQFQEYERTLDPLLSIMVSSSPVIYFMYHHYQHCAIQAGSISSTKSTDIFTLFPLLPTEIRLNIWHTIAADPQTVELSCTPISSCFPKGRWFSHNKPSVLFAICSESREVALKEYIPLKFSPDQIGIPWSILYINFARDTLWLCNDLSLLWAKDLLEKNEQLKEKLRFLVVGESLWRSLNQTVAALPSFGMLNQLAAVGFASVREGMEPAGIQLTAVSRCLLALEEVEFHS
jgi:hypothetical protein